MVVVAAGGTHEDGLPAHFRADDLEPEDATVELGRVGGVAHEQHRVIQATDGDAHVPSLRRARCAVDHVHAATGIVEGAPSDYVRWDGTIPHDAETVGDEEGHILIVTLLAND